MLRLEVLDDKIDELLLLVRVRGHHEVTDLFVLPLLFLAVPLTIQTGNETDEKRSSIGKPAPGCSISIRDANTKKELPHGENGRMWVKGPLVMQGYWGNPEATAETIVDGWLDTGDVVSIDKDGSGYIRFAGRMKQIIIHKGSNISPLEVEGRHICYPCFLRF